MSIRAKIAVLLIFLTVLTSTIIGAVGYFVLRQRLLEVGLTDGRISVTEEIARLRLLLHGVREDVVFLAQSNAVRDFLAAEGAAVDEARERLERTFAVLGRSESSRYQQIRYIDLTGQERARVNVESGTLITVPEEALQNKRNEPYFVQIQNLPRDAVHVSRLDLNREFGQIQRPHQPTIRFVTPVFDDQGHRRGGIVINVDGSRFLSGGAAGGNHVLLLDAEGKYLRDRNGEPISGLDRDPTESVSLLAPMLAEELEGKQSGTFVSECTWTGEPCATAFGRLKYDERPEAYWTVIHERPISEVLAPLRSQGVGFLVAVVAVAALAGGCGYLGALRITQRVNALARAAERIEAGDFQVKVAERGEDEFATMARAFNKMIASLKALIENDQVMLRKEREVREQLEATAAELARSNHDLEQFVYIASHDLKAPLRAIVQLADWLEEDLGPSLQGEVLANVHLLRGRALRLAALLTALGDYSRATQPSEDYRPVDTRLLLDQVFERLQPPPSVQVDASGTLPVVAAPRGVLERVFYELIGNAIKHRDREHGHVWVRGEDRGDAYQFEIEDDGPGIPARFHRRIFKIFQTLRPRDEVEGSGIGLAIVWRLLEVHGGAISVVSPPDQRGAIFRFTWPKRIVYQKVA